MADSLLQRLGAAGGDLPPAARLLYGVGLLGFVLLWQVSEPPVPFADFYQAYFDAAGRVWKGGAVPTWPSEFPCFEGFVNIPIVAWLFVPLLPFGNPGAGWVFLVPSLAAVTWAWWQLARVSRLEVSAVALLAMLFLINGPLANALREGNMTSLVLALLVLALVSWSKGRLVATGLALGLAAVLKPPLLLFGLYFALGRQWRVVAAGAAVVAGMAVLSLAVFGIAINVGWYDNCVGPFIGHVVPGFNVQSVDAFLARLVVGAPYVLEWSTQPFTPIHRLLRLPVLGLIYAAVAWPIAKRLLRQRRSAPSTVAGTDETLEFTTLIVLAVVTSPISWTHYYAFLLIPLGLHLGGRLALPPDRTTRWLMTGGYALSALPVIFPPEVHPPPVSDLVARTLVSTWLFGGMLVLAALVRGAWIRERSIAGERGGLAPPADRAAVALRPVLALLVGSGIAVSCVVWLLAPAPFKEATLDHTVAVLGGRMANDSWGPMWAALDYFERGYVDPRYTPPIYSEIFFNRHTKFQYPPTALFAMAWMRNLYVALEDWPAIRAVVSLEFLAATALAVAGLVHMRLRLCLPSGRSLHPAAVGALSLFATATFYPLVKAVTLGQIQTWINALLALALLAWVMGSRATAGLLTGAVCLIKPQYALLLLWAGLRREWRFLVSGALVVCGGLALSLHVFGLVNHLDYLRVLSFLSERGEAFYANQSVNGLLNRIMSLVDPAAFDNLVWRQDVFPPRHAFVQAGTVTTSAVVLLAALLRRRHADDGDGALDLARMTLSCTIASPIAWEHHYGVVLPILVLALAASLGATARLVWLAVGFVLAGNLLIVANATATTPLNFAQSYLLAGALIVLAILHLAPVRGVRSCHPAPPVPDKEAMAHA